MKFAITVFAALTISGTAMAHQVPVPAPRPYMAQTNLGGPILKRYQVAMPDGRVRECTETRHREAGRGVVFNKTCYRVR
jgi:hypothetical protein